jgi:hypothetical protein
MEISDVQQFVIDVDVMLVMAEFLIRKFLHSHHAWLQKE